MSEVNGVKVQYWAKDENGKSYLKSMDLGVAAYKHAHDNKMTMRQYVRTLASDVDHERGDVLDQMFAHSGLFDGRKAGMPSMTLKDLSRMELADSFRRNDGNDNSISGRLLFPQLILETLSANTLRDDGTDILGIWESLVGVTTNVAGTRVDQPKIDTTAPEESASGRIAQLAEPETVVGITVSEKSNRIPTNSIGLMVSDEALEATTIDLVTVVMEAQSRGDKVRRVTQMLKSMVLGDDDMGISALTQVKADTFDSTISTNGEITKKAYLAWLLEKQYECNLSRALTDLSGVLALDKGLMPTQTGEDSSKVMAPFAGINLGLTIPELTLLKTETFGANTIVALDPRYAIQRFVNVSASYEAIEQYVMRKATGFRVDYGETANRLYDEAWSVLSLTTS